MIYLKLFATFFKIGLFSFGGGYGMIPMIERELQANNWLSAQEFVRVISISEMTPGPIAVNTATLIGYKTAGIMGGAIATIGVALPSFILIIATSHLLYKFRSHLLIKRVLFGIKPVILALIIVALVFVARNTLFREELLHVSDFFTLMDPFSVIIMVICVAILFTLKVNPVFLLLASGAAGVIFYYLGFI